MRELRQKEIVDKWVVNNAKGYVLAVTGFGKTYVGIEAIRRCLNRNPNRVVHVVVPKKPIYNEWSSLLKKENLKAEVFTINTYITKERTCDLLIADEVHNYCNEESVEFSKLLKTTKYSFVLGLSATLDEKQQEFLRMLDIPKIDEVNLEEALTNNYIAPYDFYAVKLYMSSEEKEQLKHLNMELNKAFSCFEHNLEYVKRALSDKELQKRVEDYNQWSKGTCFNVARKVFSIIQERKEFFKKSKTKIEVATALTKHFNQRTILFSEHTDIADILASKLNTSAYHSNIKTKYFKNGEELHWTKEQIEFEKAKGTKVKAISGNKQMLKALEDFNSKETNVICAAKGLDEGANLKDINTAIILSFSSKSLQLVQRLGRVVRNAPNKRAKVVLLYIGDTKATAEKKWLDSALKGMPEPIWIEDWRELLV